MPPLHNAKGQPVKMSFLDLFGPSTPSRRSSGVSRLERKKPKSEESPPSTVTSPQSTAATEAPSEPAATQSGSKEWMKLEELALLGMKAQNMSWKEIDEALPGKDLEDIKKKCTQLYVDALANVKEEDAKKEEAKQEEEKKDDKQEAKPDEAKDAEVDKTEKSGDKKNLKEDNPWESNPWKKNWKGRKGQKGKGKAAEAKPEENKSDEVKLEEAKPEETKGTLKAKATAEEKGKGGDLKSIEGHPVIFVDDDEELDFNELLYLYGLNARYDELKWITVDSKFFDKYGKRVGPKKLKEKLAGI